MNLIVLLLQRNLFILFIIKSVGSKNISFNSLKSNIIVKFHLNNLFFSMRNNFFIYEPKIFSSLSKDVKNEEMISNFGQLNSISISC